MLEVLSVVVLLLRVLSLTGSSDDFAAQKHRIVLAVKQQNIQYLESFLYSISDPDDVSFRSRSWLSRSEVALITANSAGHQRVLKFLERSCPEAVVLHQSLHGEYIVVEGPRRLWNEVFRTNLVPVKHPSGKWMHRAEHMTLPSDLSSVVSAVFNLVDLPPVVVPATQLSGTPHIHVDKDSSGESDESAANEFETTTINLINQYYHIPSNDGHGLGSQAIFASLEQAYSAADIRLFQEKYGLKKQNIAENIGQLPGSQDFCKFLPLQCCEASLDVEYMMGTAQNVKTTFWYTSELDSEDIFLDWIVAVSSTPQPPYVHTISYGALEETVPDSYTQAFNIEVRDRKMEWLS